MRAWASDVAGSFLFAYARRTLSATKYKLAAQKISPLQLTCERPAIARPQYTSQIYLTSPHFTCRGLPVFYDAPIDYHHRPSISNFSPRLFLSFARFPSFGSGDPRGSCARIFVCNLVRGLLNRAKIELRIKKWIPSRRNWSELLFHPANGTAHHHDRLFCANVLWHNSFLQRHAHGRPDQS